MASEWPVQQVGSKGEDVRCVQSLLIHHGHPTVVDGTFGPATKQAVKDFQAASGLTDDGIVGAQTWAALIVTVAAGASGDAVRAAQGELRTQGWRLALDGSFGPQTAGAVRDFQTARNLVVDGIVGPLTWQTLVADFTRLATAELAASHLYDAWGANDRRTALTGATQAAVDLVLRGQRGDLHNAGCAPQPELGPDHFICAYTYEGGAVDFFVRGNTIGGFYVESAAFIAD